MQLKEKIKDSWLYDIEIDLYFELDKLDADFLTYIVLVNKNMLILKNCALII